MLAEGLVTAYALLDAAAVAVRAGLDSDAEFYEDQRAALTAEYDPATVDAAFSLALAAIAAFDLPARGAGPMLIGYARVSTDDQKPSRRSVSSV
jgi:hypothetical protein